MTPQLEFTPVKWCVLKPPPSKRGGLFEGVYVAFVRRYNAFAVLDDMGYQIGDLYLTLEAAREAAEARARGILAEIEKENA